MQNASVNCHYLDPQLVREPPRLELNFTFPLEHVTELIALGDRLSSVAVDKFGIVGKTIQNAWCFPPTNYELYPTTQVSSIGTLVLFPLTMFQFFPMKLLPKSIHNPVICRVSIACWMQTLVAHCLLKTLSVDPVSSAVQAAVQADDASSTTISYLRLRFLRDICSFSPLQVQTRINYWSTRC